MRARRGHAGGCRRRRIKSASELTTTRALMLGALQGPAELMPVSSSAHIALVPWFAGWDVARLDPESRKSFEVALHAGAAAALLIGQRAQIREELRRLDRRRAAVVGLSLVPPALVGYALERPIERSLGKPLSIAASLVVGSVAMLLADRRPQERGPGDAGPLDGVALGIAQAAALVPGVSRNGATLTAARWRRFSREEAEVLSRTVALPIISGATALKAVRMRSRGVESALRVPALAGVAASFASTLASQRLLVPIERGRPLWPYAAYRFGLAGAVLFKLRRGWRKLRGQT